MTADLAAADCRSGKVRAALSNGSKTFSAADGRSSGARLLRDREYELAAPLGGWPQLTPTERLRVSSAAMLSVRQEQLRSGLARGEMGVSDEDLVRLSNVLGRELAALERLAAARRKAKPQGSALADYLAAKAAEVAA
jgi:hypothetical protein